MVESLRQVRLAQLRARAVRWAIGRVALGSAFLAGALGYARAPDRHSDGSAIWMSLLLVMSTLYLALGLRMLARVRRRAAWLWMAATAAWGLSALAVVMFLLRQ